MRSKTLPVHLKYQYMHDRWFYIHGRREGDSRRSLFHHHNYDETNLRLMVSL
jgi:hypothetical protein